MSNAARKITPAIEQKIRELVAIAGGLHAELSSVTKVIKNRAAERRRAAENLIDLEAELKDATTARRWNRAGADGQAVERCLERVKQELDSEQNRDAQIAAEIEVLNVREVATREAWNGAGNIAEAILRSFGNDRHRIEKRMEGTR